MSCNWCVNDRLCSRVLIGNAAERFSSGQPCHPRTRRHIHINCDSPFRSRNLRPAHNIHTHRYGHSSISCASLGFSLKHNCPSHKLTRAIMWGCDEALITCPPLQVLLQRHPASPQTWLWVAAGVVPPTPHSPSALATGARVGSRSCKCSSLA